MKKSAEPNNPKPFFLLISLFDILMTRGKNDKKKKPRYRRRLIHNRNFQYGFIFLIIALILSFASINLTHAESVQSGQIPEEDRDDLFSVRLDTPIDVINRTIRLTYVANESTENATLQALEEPDSEALKTFEIEPNESIEESLPAGTNWLIVKHENEGMEGVIFYEHVIEYRSYPYAWASIPALLFVMMGVIFIYRSYMTIIQQVHSEEQQRRDEDGVPFSPFGEKMAEEEETEQEYETIYEKQ